MVLTTEQDNPRKPEFPIDPIFTNRWSPRALSGEEITKDELMSLFEAARWAPSSYNNQPWKFVYSMKGDSYWDEFFDLMVDANKSWAKNAGALVLVISRKNFHHNDKPSKTHTFDTGASWQNLALQASISGLVSHGMEGFDYDKAREILELSDQYEIHAMIAIGKPGDKESLSEETRKMESPNGRKSVSEISFNGRLKE